MNATLRRGFIDGRHALGAGFAALTGVAGMGAVLLAAVLEPPSTPGLGPSGRGPSLLLAVAFGLVLPLANHAFQGRAGGQLSELMGAAGARYGGDRRVYALGRLASPLASGAIVSMLAAALALLSSFAFATGLDTQRPALGGQLLLVVGLALLGSLSYGACLALAQLFAGNTGRLAWLAGDWLLGSGVGVAALPWPRAHLRALLDGAPVLGLSELDSCQFLVGVALIGALLFVRLIPR